jgi:hypothetical protein
MLLSTSAFAQTTSQTELVVEPLSPTPVFHVSVTSRSVQAINYKHRGGATKLDFAGTDLMPAANGQAKVESKKGYIEIEVEFGNLQKPTVFGGEYLTYILWAISPEGRAMNLGEILVGDNHRSKVDVTTDLQAFALVVTAEPYYAVRQPSNLVILENVVREDTRGTTEAMNTKYELMERGGYIPSGYKFDPVVLNTNLPLEFFEARNAVRIAESEGAEQYANDSYQHAVRLMDKVDRFATSKHRDRKAMIAVAREMLAQSPSRGSMSSVWTTNVRLPLMRRHRPRQKQTMLPGRRTRPSLTRPEQRSPKLRQSRTPQTRKRRLWPHKLPQQTRKPQKRRPKLIPQTHKRTNKRLSLTQQQPGPVPPILSRTRTRPELIWPTARLHQPPHFPQPRLMPINPARPHSRPS